MRTVTLWRARPARTSRTGSLILVTPAARCSGFHRLLRLCMALRCAAIPRGQVWQVGEPEESSPDIHEKSPAMPVIAVINRKGGSGKSTLATHLAGYYANAGAAVMLGDVDRQLSTQTWLRQRKTRQLGDAKEITGWTSTRRASYVHRPAPNMSSSIRPAGCVASIWCESSCTRTRS